MNSQGIVHIIDFDGGPIEAKACLFAGLNLEPRVHHSPLEFLRGFTHVRPCCLVSAMRLPDLLALELLARLQKQAVPPPAIMISANPGIKSAVQAMKLGAAEFLEFPVNDELLLGLTQHWIRTDRNRLNNSRKCRAIREKLAKLSARERDVLAGVIDGLSNKEMARRLGISSKTVEVYRSKLMAKMEASSIPGLVREVLLCPFQNCSPIEFGCECSGLGACSNNPANVGAFETISAIHFSQIEYAASKQQVKPFGVSPY
jgi:two-component system, LuxR family, response regulator FixJ